MHLMDLPIFAYSDSQVAVAWIRLHESKWLPDSPKRARNCVCRLTLIRVSLKHKVIAIETVHEEKFLTSLCLRFSSLIRMVRVIAYVKRAVWKIPKLEEIRNQIKRLKEKEKKPCDVALVPLTTDETSSALHSLLSMSQEIHFFLEIKLLSEGKPICKKFKIKALYPFVDENLHLRVGGRLQCQEILAFIEKHPLFLDKICPLAEEAHLETLLGVSSWLLVT